MNNKDNDLKNLNEYLACRDPIPFIFCWAIGLIVLSTLIFWSISIYFPNNLDLPYIPIYLKPVLSLAGEVKPEELIGRWLFLSYVIIYLVFWFFYFRTTDNSNLKIQSLRRLLGLTSMHWERLPDNEYIKINQSDEQEVELEIELLKLKIKRDQYHESKDIDKHYDSLEVLTKELSLLRKESNLVNTYRRKAGTSMQVIAILTAVSVLIFRQFLHFIKTESQQIGLWDSSIAWLGILTACN